MNELSREELLTKLTQYQNRQYIDHINILELTGGNQGLKREVQALKIAVNNLSSNLKVVEADRDEYKAQLKAATIRENYQELNTVELSEAEIDALLHGIDDEPLRRRIPEHTLNQGIPEGITFIDYEEPGDGDDSDYADKARAMMAEVNDKFGAPIDDKKGDK